ncbi:hypothetical protein FZI27_20335 [Cronobacter sakazakii]|nr:hypothetical protein FZI27_20335 [Cronobacter sakazakii]
MTLRELFFEVSNATNRPLLAYEIIFLCVDMYRQDQKYVLKHTIDEMLCVDTEKRKGFSKNTISVISALEKSGILKKYSIVNGELADYRGSPFALAVSLDAAVLSVFNGDSAASTALR